MAQQSEQHNTHDSITPRWKYIASIYRPLRQYVVFRDEAIGLQRQLLIRRNPMFFQSCDREYFYIDGIARSFKSERAMLRALSKCTTDRPRILEWKLYEPGPTFRSSLLALKRIITSPLRLWRSIFQVIDEIEPESEQLGKSGATTTTG